MTRNTPDSAFSFSRLNHRLLTANLIALRLRVFSSFLLLGFIIFINIVNVSLHILLTFLANWIFSNWAFAALSLGARIDQFWLLRLSSVVIWCEPYFGLLKELIDCFLCVEPLFICLFGASTVAQMLGKKAPARNWRKHWRPCSVSHCKFAHFGVWCRFILFHSIWTNNKVYYSFKYGLL